MIDRATGATLNTHLLLDQTNIVTLSDPYQNSPSEKTGKRERAKAANRLAILKAARIVFAELGYDATTVRDIIRRTDLASGTFYNYFKSKEEIHDALVRQTVLDFSEVFRRRKREDMSLEAYLTCAFGAYFEFLAQQHEEVLKLSDPYIFKSVILVESPEVKAIFQEIRKDIDSFLAKDGHKTVDPDYLTASAIGIAREVGDCMLHRMVRKRSEYSTEFATGFATNLLLNGIRHMTDKFER